MKIQRDRYTSQIIAKNNIRNYLFVIISYKFDVLCGFQLTFKLQNETVAASTSCNLLEY